jgi:hypothetical protein
MKLTDRVFMAAITALQFLEEGDQEEEANSYRSVE